MSPLKDSSLGKPSWMSSGVRFTSFCVFQYNPVIGWAITISIPDCTCVHDCGEWSIKARKLSVPGTEQHMRASELEQEEMIREVIGGDKWKMMRQTLKQNKMNRRHWDKDVIKCCLSSVYSLAREQEQLSRQRMRVLKRGAGFINKQSSHVHRAHTKKSFMSLLSQSCQYVWNKGPIFLFDVYSTKLSSHSFSGPLHAPPSLKGSQFTAHNPRRHLKCCYQISLLLLLQLAPKLYIIYSAYESLGMQEWK